MRYNWQNPNWPNFHYDLTSVQSILYQYARESSRLSGALQQIPEDHRQEALIELTISEAFNTSAIEGEFYSQLDIRSSIRNQLGLTNIPERVHDPRADGISKLLILSRQNLKVFMTKEILWQWHDALIQDPYQRYQIQIGQWRTDSEPMQIVSGPMGRYRVHFEAPPSEILSFEMNQFLEWVNGVSPLQGPVKAAIAHLYFESIHPFDDGNGRIGRAISERILSQEIGMPVLLSLSKQIMAVKAEYYSQLAEASSYSLDITPWINFFCQLVLDAQLSAKDLVQFVLKKAKFWAKYSNVLSDRQIRVVQRMLEAGTSGFEGGISSKKYMKIVDCSKATATRDLTDLVEKGCIHQLEGNGRNTRYELSLD